MNIKIKRMVKIAVVAAIYVALTLFFHPISFGSIQLRISEVLVLLVFYNKRYALSVVVGCLIANAFSTLGLDVIFGTFASLIACLLMMLIPNNRFLASLIPPIINGIIVGLEIHIMTDANFFLCALTIFLGEFIVVVVIGNILCSIFEKNETFKKLMDDTI